MTVDVVIVNWNAGLQLKECIKSVRDHGSGVIGKCIVIDNGSSDGSIEFLRNAHDVELVPVGRNIGFAAGCNLGAGRASAEFILFLNPDAFLMVRSLARPLDFMRNPENASVGIVGIQLIGDDGKVQRSCARFPKPISFVAKSLGVAAVVKSLDFHMQNWDHSETTGVDHVIGAFYLIRRGVFEGLGGFDERFFVYLEDLDLSLRASKLGYATVYLADAQAFHAGGGTSHQVKARRLFYSLRSRLQYAAKHFSTGGTLVVGATTLLIEPFARCGQALMRGRTREVREVFTAYRWLLGWLVGGRTG
jgi:GT2 family glycosyltransferase